MNEYIFRTNKSIKCCGDCPAIKSPAGFTGNTYYDGCYLDENLEVMAEERHENCPLVELPEHGRLGDLDLMKENFAESLRITRQQVELDSDSPFYGLQQRDLANAEKLVNGLINRTPTVLEASE